MKKNSCKDCAHYRRHYIFDKRRIFRIYCGHCIFTKVSRKRPDSKICEHFILSNTDESAFVSKEYLSKELLQYLLNLELLPEISDTEE